MKGMIYAGENPPMMETPSTTFGKQKLVTLTRYQALLFIVIFATCIVATALLVYHFSPCHNCSKIEESTVIVYDKHSKNADSTTTIAGVAAEENHHHTTEGVVVTSTLAAPVASISTEEPKTDDQKMIDVRLPRSIHPHSYKIKLVPFIQEGNFTFHGDVKILINVSVSSRNITLHADELIIDDVFVYEYLKPDQFISIERFANDTRRQFLIIHLQNPVEAGTQYYVNIKFRGVLNDLLQGFYRSSYKVGNETRWIAATQFQATDARKAFPCFDEPALKAKFQLNLARFKNMTSISNMRKIHDPIPVNDLPDYEWDTYEESLPMSTYLVAFVISDFGNITNGPFSIWARRSALSQAKYSLQVGPKILSFYEEFFGIKYPLPKVDMVALPDFSAGAMENWGLITYRESALLYEEKVSSKNSLDNIVHVIAHELAHQWFGNLVTPTWWTDLWLNEGFATYVEFLGANAVNPDWKILDQFLISELHVALTLDAFQSSHPISIIVNDPDEIDDIFDQISYSKGAAILRMMQHFLSMETFRKGLHGYLSERVYKSAEQDDLWEALTRQSHQDQIIEPDITIKQIMDTWTLQTGYPVVKVERNYRNGSIIFSQQRFLNIKDSNKTSELWWIPLTLKTSSNDSVSSVWIKSVPKLHLNSLNVSNSEWLLVNVNQTGYYRVNYDETNWNLLMRQLQKKDGHLIFDPKNRAQLLDDAMKLASAGHIDYNIALNLTKYLVQEREYVPWMAALNGLDYLYERFVRTAHFDKYKNYLLHLIDGFYKEIGFRENDNDSQLRIYSRHEIYQRACRLGVRDCIINAVQQFQTWRNSPNPDKYNLISENLREVVYCTAMSVGGQEEWDFAWQRYLNANVGNEKEILLMALGCSKEIWILSRYLEWSITENSGIRKQDSARVFATVANNLVGQELAYRFLKTNLDRLKAYLGSSSMSLSSIIRSCTSRMDTQEEVDDFKNFLIKNSNDIGVGVRTTQQVLEQGMFRVKWMETNFKNIVNWLSSVDS